jgi:hypothetical protein
VSLASFAEFRRSVLSLTPLRGGDINAAFRVVRADGQTGSGWPLPQRAESRTG